MSPASPVALDPEQAQWVQGPLSILVATCGALRRPHVARAVGCCVGSDRRTVSVLLHPATAVHVLDDLRADGRVAVVFCDPLTNRSLQVKADAARVEAAGPGGAELAQLWVRGFARRIEGHVPAAWAPQAIADAWLTGRLDDLVTVSLVPGAVFDQTPGPAAGRALA